MNLSILCAGIWFLIANVLAMIPSNDNHWRHAYILMVVGIPLLGWLTYENGWLIGFLALLGGGWILRWPVYYAWRYIEGLFTKE
ncbi:hypothetical protein GCM10008927_18000 [Amylibacter ulvae]|uniref:DUF2484 family protein n=1 Tax=Paramylibacter ulvae TaxID=1651968 RepID=A0ABQ3D0P4_9RHOB|nr:DUF2484 family protein [Amylibacter ulvae]GHA52746.1 hypothetical protein GCM10008927_18000 [Amylibacter ulvae]